ncbi:MAG: hypothetical protein ACLQDV_17265 [Candidatus Binataceae bacterium]
MGAATTSLARLLDKQGKHEEARTMLVEIHSWFTDRFDTADLKDAKVDSGRFSTDIASLRGPLRCSRQRGSAERKGWRTERPTDC